MNLINNRKWNMLKPTIQNEILVGAIESTNDRIDKLNVDRIKEDRKTLQDVKNSVDVLNDMFVDDKIYDFINADNYNNNAVYTSPEWSLDFIMYNNQKLYEGEDYFKGLYFQTIDKFVYSNGGLLNYTAGSRMLAFKSVNEGKRIHIMLDNVENITLVSTGTAKEIYRSTNEVIYEMKETGTFVVNVTRGCRVFQININSA